MFYRLKKISAPQGYLSCHFFVWYITIIIITPCNPYRTLFFIVLSALLIMLYVSFPSLRLVIHSYRFSDKKGIARVKLLTRYQVALLSMFVATVFGSATAVCVARIDYFHLEEVLIFLLAFSASGLISLKYFMLSIGTHEDDEKGVLSGIIKFSLLFIVSVTFALSAKLIMDVMDISDVLAASKKTTLAFQVVFAIYLAPVIIPFFYMSYVFIKKRKVEIRKKSPESKARFFLVEYDFFSIAIPLCITLLVCFIGVAVNKRAFINAVINRAIEMDTSISFNCNGYKMLNLKDDARYLLVSDNNYRAFVRNGDSYSTYRLTCINAYPYYQLRFIPGDKKEIRLQMAEDQLIEDMNKVIKK
ncbi:hypothetical protein [Erwinia mallotivora]|uniref:hypothetical protein n=1 Tax=Erwinia mallotivora TaxID=69222 RepID=UPI0021BF96D0|nr:hypothetical protein [Erwinia mallotivora]